MFELIERIPDPWRQQVDVLIAPLAWIPRLQHMLWEMNRWLDTYVKPETPSTSASK